jgi:micrococcal nuclease
MIRFIVRNALRTVLVFALYSAFSAPETRAQFVGFAKSTVAAAANSVTGSTSASSSANLATVVRVVDGDTFVVRMPNSNAQTKIRMIGVNTPESTTKVECYGKKAAAFTKAILLPGTKVALTYDKELNDKYGRTLAYVKTSSGTDVQRLLLQSGMARTMSIKPNTSRRTEFALLETAARAARLGLWGVCR